MLLLYLFFLNEYVYVVLSTIKAVLEEGGWYYDACRRCNRKVIPKSKVVDLEDIDEAVNDANNTLWCKSCKQPANNAVLKYVISFKPILTEIKVCSRIQLLINLPLSAL